jgi:hypothetical protein
VNQERTDRRFDSNSSPSGIRGRYFSLETQDRLKGFVRFFGDSVLSASTQRMSSLRGAVFVWRTCGQSREHGLESVLNAAVELRVLESARFQPVSCKNTTSVRRFTVRELSALRVFYFVAMLTYELGLFEVVNS